MRLFKLPIKKTPRTARFQSSFEPQSQVARNKLVGEQPLGRHFFQRISMPALTRKAREAICPDGAGEFDQKNAVANIMPRTAQTHNFDAPCLERCCESRDFWREAVAQYYRADTETAKMILLKAILGVAKMDMDCEQFSVLPPLHGLPDANAKNFCTLVVAEPHH